MNDLGRLEERKQILSDRLAIEGRLEQRAGRAADDEEVSRLKFQMEEIDQRLHDVVEKLDNVHLKSATSLADENIGDENDEDEDDGGGSISSDEEDEDEEPDVSPGHSSSGSLRPNFPIDYAQSTIRGRRETNEDAHAIVQSKRHPNRALMGLFDGHGGFLCSRFCARRLPVLLDEKMQLSDDLIQEAFVELDAEYLEECEDDGSCACVALFTSDDDNHHSNFTIANLGDSRALLIRSSSSSSSTSELQVLTSDHKPDVAEEKQRIEAAGASVVVDRLLRHGKRVHVARVDGQLAVSRAIGDDALKDADVSQQRDQAVTPIPQVTRGSWSQDDILVIGCDGLWDVCSNRQVAAAVKKYEAEGKNLPQIAQALCDLALQKNSDDNVSVILARKTAATAAGADQEGSAEEFGEQGLTKLARLLKDFEEREEDEEVDRLTALLKHVDVDGPSLSRTAQSDPKDPSAPPSTGDQEEKEIEAQEKSKGLPENEDQDEDEDEDDLYASIENQLNDSSTVIARRPSVTPPVETRKETNSVSKPAEARQLYAMHSLGVIAALFVALLGIAIYFIGPK